MALTGREELAGLAIAFRVAYAGAKGDGTPASLLFCADGTVSDHLDNL